MNDLQPILAAPDYAETVNVESRLFLWPMQDCVRALGKQTADGVWWLVVNESPLPLQYTLTAGEHRVARSIAAHEVQVIAPTAE